MHLCLQLADNTPKKRISGRSTANAGGRRTTIEAVCFGPLPVQIDHGATKSLQGHYELRHESQWKLDVTVLDGPTSGQQLNNDSPNVAE